MAKSSREQIDEDERKILAELQKNSNENIDTIAKRCGFLRQKVWRLIKQLEASQKIWGYSAIVDAEKQGLQKFIIFFKQAPDVLNQKTAEKVNLDEIKKNYSELDITLETSHYIHGEYDWIIIFTAKDIKQAKKFINLLQEKYPGLIEKINLSQVLYTTRDHCILNPDKLKVKEFI
ncbi:MAG TPA: Lrp/AsnC family transcriptional regulator [Candidatus Thermoplasmatota archaeon]|nr:Lrp/AsnC family transcriptional regulator [Candidatus Thermoplasmatota archaeon]